MYLNTCASTLVLSFVLEDAVSNSFNSSNTATVNPAPVYTESYVSSTLMFLFPYLPTYLPIYLPVNPSKVACMFLTGQPALALFPMWFSPAYSIIIKASIP